MALVNFRDIGSFKTSNRKKVKEKTLFRAGDLSFLEKEEAEFLLKQTEADSYIDLRNDFEFQKSKLNYFAQIIPKVYRVQFNTQDEKFSSIRLPCASDWANFYLRLFEKNVHQIIYFLEILSIEAQRSIIFGCSAGKDRTGIMSAVLLSLLEVSQNEIVEDFCLSNQGLINHYALFNDEKIELGRTREEFIKNFLTVSENTMKTFLCTITIKYGSILSYLLKAGLSASLIEKLRLKFVEPC